MISQNQLRLRQAKKKIFYDSPNRSKPQDKSTRDNNTKAYQSQLGRSTNAVQQLKKHVQELQVNNNQLKKLLREERERYDRLFQQYEDLAQKNSLIEKQYINLKYQHNKQIKQLKRAISSIIIQRVEKGFQQFQLNLKEQKVSATLKLKLQKFIQKMRELAKVTEKYRVKKDNKKGDVYQYVEQKSRNLIGGKSTLSEKKINVFELDQVQPIEKESIVTKSPDKQKQLQSVRLQSEIGSKQFIAFEDEYYGQIQDFTQYQEKIVQRRNFELMRKNSRNSNEIKRKKIFEQM